MYLCAVFGHATPGAAGAHVRMCNACPCHQGCSPQNLVWGTTSKRVVCTVAHLNEETEHGEHGQAAVLDLLDLHHVEGDRFLTLRWTNASSALLK
jgi:hypothetical protein